MIGSYEPDLVAYIANLGPFSKTPKGSPFADGLEVVSSNIFFKRRPNAFSNPALAKWLESVDAQNVKIIGIDGNWCIKATALGVVEHGFTASVLMDAVSSKNEEAFRSKTIPKLISCGVSVV